MPLPFHSTPTFPFGTRTLTIGGVNYVCNNFNATKDAEAIRRNTAAGAPNGLVLVENPGRCNFSAQLALTSTTLPTLGVTFATDTSWATTTTFVTRSVGQPEEQRGFKTVDVECEEVV